MNYQVLIAGALIAIGFIWGTKREKQHYNSIRKREKELQKLSALSFKTPPVNQEDIIEQKLVMGSTVISIDHFKRFIAGLRMIIGGTLTSYESLVDRARRESILRMKEQCQDFDMIINTKVETASISKGQEKSVGSIEVLAYGTALKIRKRD